MISNLFYCLTCQLLPEASIKNDFVLLTALQKGLQSNY